MNENVVIFPHNKRAYEAVCSAFKTSNRTCVIQPTGTGKMYIAMQLMDDHPNEETLYLTSYSPILSALDTEMKKCGVPSEHLSTALYAGLDAEVCAKQYAYIIMDEFHRAGAEIWGTWVSTLLENNPQAKVLGLSATPIRYLDNNRDMSDELFDGNVASSMTLAEGVGLGILKMPKYVCAVYSLAEELERYKERVGKMKADANKTEALALLEKARRSLEQADGLSEIFAQHTTVKDGRYIVFCRNYEHMESMEAECIEWFEDVNSEITMYELRTTHSDSINEQTLSAFNADRSPKLKLLFVVDMLNEGVHLKNVDGCIMLRPTESMNVFLQQLGRAISVGNAGHTTIFDIVNNSAQLNAFGHFKGDVERASVEGGAGIQLEDFEIHESLRNFMDIVSQIDVLLSNKNWDEWFNLAKDFYLQNGHLSMYSRFVTSSGDSLGLWLTRQRRLYQDGKLSSEQIQKLESVGMVWDLLDAAWERKFELAKEYKATHGSLDITTSYETPQGDKLGQWIGFQRRRYKNGDLPLEQQHKLESIGMIWDPRIEGWEQMFSLASQYYKEHGNLAVKHDYTCPTGDKLGQWIHCQRRAQRNGTLPLDRKQSLESIGMIWDVREAKWVHMFEVAKEYRHNFGNLCVPDSYVSPNGDRLGVWIANQRNNYKKGKLTIERIEQLESIGIVWKPKEDEWDRMFAVAEHYFKDNGNLNVPWNYKTFAGDSLGMWIGGQRAIYKSGNLSSDRTEKLESIGMVWELTDEWDVMFMEAASYVKKNGNLLVPEDFITPSGMPLGEWIQTQRTKRKDGKLSFGRKKRLDSIGMVWNLISQPKVDWEVMFSVAEHYFQVHGNLLVPYDFVTSSGDKLGGWIIRQRDCYKEGKLPLNKLKKLESIGMVWVVNDACWEQSFAYAHEYWEEHGNLLVPATFKTASGASLGTWIASQRTNYRAGKLSLERQLKLEAIGMVWNPLDYEWDRMYSLAKDYYVEFGNLMIAVSYKTKNGDKLGQWISSQRRNYKNGKLSSDRINKLESIGMVWKPNK